jgi:hypothetical protein
MMQRTVTVEAMSPLRRAVMANIRRREAQGQDRFTTGDVARTVLAELGPISEAMVLAELNAFAFDYLNAMAPSLDDMLDP